MIYFDQILHTYAYTHSKTTRCEGLGFAEHQYSLLWLVYRKRSLILKHLGNLDQMLHTYLF